MSSWSHGQIQCMTQIIGNSLEPWMVTLVHKMVDLFWHLFSAHYGIYFRTPVICHTAVFPSLCQSLMVQYSNINSDMYTASKDCENWSKMVANLTYFGRPYFNFSSLQSRYSDVILTEVGQIIPHLVQTIVTIVSQSGHLEFTPKIHDHQYCIHMISDLHVHTPVFMALIRHERVWIIYFKNYSRWWSKYHRLMWCG